MILRTVDELQLTKSYQDNFKNMSKREQNNLQYKAGVAKMHATMFILLAHLAAYMYMQSIMDPKMLM